MDGKCQTRVEFKEHLHTSHCLSIHFGGADLPHGSGRPCLPMPCDARYRQKARPGPSLSLSINLKHERDLTVHANSLTHSCALSMELDGHIFEYDLLVVTNMHFMSDFSLEQSLSLSPQRWIQFHILFQYQLTLLTSCLGHPCIIHREGRIWAYLGINLPYWQTPYYTLKTGSVSRPATSHTSTYLFVLSMVFPYCIEVRFEGVSHEDKIHFQ